MALPPPAAVSFYEKCSSAGRRSAEPGSLVVRVGFEDRAELFAAAPDVYYVTDHYLGYGAVLVPLSRITPDVRRDLLGMAHKFVTARRAR